MNLLILLALVIFTGVTANPVFVTDSVSKLAAASPADLSANCPTGYTQPAGSDWPSCYKIYLDFKARNNAATQCKKHNGTLASVPDAFVNTYIYSLASQNKATSLWIGVECINGDSKSCVNDDTTEFTYDNFYGGQPNVDGNCVYLSSIGRDSQKWSSFDCAQKFQYACEAPAAGQSSATTNVETTTTTPVASTTTATTTASGQEGLGKCPENYTSFENLCYTFAYLGIEFIPATFASTICKDVAGGYLATIPNARVNSFLETIKPHGILTYTAFGLNCPNVTIDGDRSSCKWDDGTTYAYNAFEIPGVPHSYPFNGGYCDYHDGEWWDCYPSVRLQFDSYICQAPLR